ncbi:mRNA cap guanine-N7 methyltransferase [Entomophthora muscae]|uniref:mRNA cap guanine-N7 methyltransferase n=1 Tax=Entomophthora muscae TaxID=34485 RepID=A0ACC2T002_9FUNG|nr:mRNA cap guanine-N7 methyltransferase [Entomophthora muscae]
MSQPSRKKPRSEVEEVADHYNQRPEVGIKKRKESSIYRMKSFNNWVKSVLIRNHVKNGYKILDLGCGKGGDLLKYSKSKISFLVGADIASVSIEQAKERYKSMKFDKFEAEFLVHDCFGKPIKEHLPKEFTADAVSMQFCMHYAFESEEKVRTMLKNVSENMKTGGVLYATVPNSYWIVKKLKASSGLKFGNSIYSIKFESKDKFPIFGHKYWFCLEDAIDDCPEFLIHFPTLQKIAAEYKLELIFKKGFHEIYEAFCQHEEYNELLYRMNVISDPSNTHDPLIDPEQWEAAGIYLGCAFKKV